MEHDEICRIIVEIAQREDQVGPFPGPQPRGFPRLRVSRSRYGKVTSLEDGITRLAGRNVIPGMVREQPVTLFRSRCRLPDPEILLFEFLL